MFIFSNEDKRARQGHYELKISENAKNIEGKKICTCQIHPVTRQADLQLT